LKRTDVVIVTFDSAVPKVAVWLTANKWDVDRSVRSKLVSRVFGDVDGEMLVSGIRLEFVDSFNIVDIVVIDILIFAVEDIETCLVENREASVFELENVLRVRVDEGNIVDTVWLPITASILAGEVISLVRLFDMEVKSECICWFDVDANETVVTVFNLLPVYVAGNLLGWWLVTVDGQVKPARSRGGIDVELCVSILSLLLGFVIVLNWVDRAEYALVCRDHRDCSVKVLDTANDGVSETCPVFFSVAFDDTSVLRETAKDCVGVADDCLGTVVWSVDIVCTVVSKVLRMYSWMKRSPVVE
jgi:hypothetical protein